MQLQIMAAQARKGNWELSLRLSEPVLLVLWLKEEGILLFTEQDRLNLTTVKKEQTKV